MRLALIPPIALLPYTTYTDYQLMLPHLLTDHRYKGWYMWLCQQSKQYVILDNGEAEGQNRFSPSELLMIGNIFGVDEIIAPDTIRDVEATLTQTTMFLRQYDREDVNRERLRVGVVAQGETLNEFKRIVDLWMRLYYPDMLHTIHIPRHMLTTLDDRKARIKFVRWLADKYGKDLPKVHLLGANSEWSGEMAAAQEEIGHIVRGMDTSMPFNYAHSYTKIGSPERVNRPDNYFDLHHDQFDDNLVYSNIKTALQWVSDD